MTPWTLTDHAAARLRQRGIPYRLVDAVLRNADVEADVGNGCLVLRVSKKFLHRKASRRRFGQDIDRAAKLAVIVNPIVGEIVTVMHDLGTDRRLRPGRH